MLLLPEIISQQDGAGPAIETNQVAEALTLTLEITAAQEQQGLEVSVYGSTDGETWSERPLARFPWRSYVGRYTLPLDLRNKKVRLLKTAWRMKRWTPDAVEPVFSFRVAAV